MKLKDLLKRSTVLLRLYKNITAALLKNSLVFQVHLTYHCNLKCKSCSHFSPISDEKYLDMNDFEKDLKQLSSLRGSRKVRQIDLLGGEPLLHPHINSFIAIARKYFKKAKIVLFTNGILLPKMTDDFWRACRKNKITVSISRYPVNIDFDAIKRNAEKYKVMTDYSLQADYFAHFIIDVDGNQNEKENAEHCFEAKNCHCLDKGKMFLCYLPACIDIFNKRFNKNIPVSQNDYIDIYKAKNLSEIINFLKNAMPFCKYCNMSGRNYTEWGVSKKDIQEWT